MEYKLQWRSLSIHLELIAGSCRKINFIFFNTKNNNIIYRHTVLYFHFLTSVGSWICSLSSLTFTVWYFFILVYQYSQHLGKRGKGGCLTVDNVNLSMLKHFNKRLALQKVNLWRYTYSYYQNEQSLYIYKHVHTGILNVYLYSSKKFKSWNKCFWINDSKVHLWRCGILHHAIKVWKRYGLDTY